MAKRLGAVSYLNTKPLVRALETGAVENDFDLVFDVPSVCAERLAARDTDVALIPSIEIARANEPYVVVPEAAIVSFGPVQSVLLVHRTEARDIRTLAMDSGSRTSASLIRIVLARQFNCRPEVFESPPDLDGMLERADAALVIGDTALELDRKALGVMDLGEAWTEMTGLPFVYACWTGRPGALTPAQTQQLIEAKESGRAEIPAIADSYAKTHRHPPAFYDEYLSTSIRYTMGEPELEGLDLYYRYAEELGFVERVPEIGFHPLS